MVDMARLKYDLTKNDYKSDHTSSHPFLHSIERAAV